MKILLVDDHVSFCEGLIAAISNSRPEFEFQFESDSELVPASLLGAVNFDIVIVDIMMPGLGGVELIKHLNAMHNFVPILVMSSVEDIAIIRKLFDLGVLGFIPKYYSVGQVIAAIEQCHAGRIHMPDNMRSEIIAHVDHLDKNESLSDSGDVAESFGNTSLTKRQVEILGLMDQGMTNQEMAESLFISIATVKTHIHKLYSLFEVNNRVSCLRAAKKARLR